MNENNIPITYRNWLHGTAPKRIKLELPGWAGQDTWETPQPWHCKPFADANTYGLELIYTWQTPCTVVCDKHGMCTFDADFEAEKPKYLGKDWYPFACFAPFHFGFVSMVDIKTPPGHNLMVMPHPRYFADHTGTVPCAVPGQLEMDWWPEIFFIVFKAPILGQKLTFKHGDPIAQFMVVPRNIKYDIQPMSDEDAALRAERQGTLEKNWNRICTRVFYCKDDPGCEKDNFFDNKYKVLSQIAKRDGVEIVDKILDDPTKLPHWNKNPQVVDHRDPKDQIVKHAPWTGKKKVNIEDEPISLTNEDLEQMYDPDILNKVDAIITNDRPVTDAEIDVLIADFKRQKRKKRTERSNKLKKKTVVLANQPKPEKVINVQAKKNDGEYVLGYKIEKLL